MNREVPDVGRRCEEATIRILADGRISFDGFPGGLLEIAAAVAPHHDGIRRRLEDYRRLSGRSARSRAGEECSDGNAASDARA